MLRLLPLLFLALIVGFTATQHAVTQEETIPQSVNLAQSSAADFMSYRQALLNYIESSPNLPAATGEVPLSALIFPPGVVTSSFPGGFGNYVKIGAAMRTVYIWWPVSAEMMQSLQSSFPGDATLGFYTNGVWINLAGSNLGAMPSYVPSGDVLSVVEIGE